MLHLDETIDERLEKLARAGYPNEVCGVLVGRSGSDGTTVVRAEEAANLAVERRRDRYVLDPDDFRAADEAARRDSLDIVGIWHTHPDHPAEPSPTDLERAWEGYAYLIVAVHEGRVVDRRCWQLDGDRFVECPLDLGKPATP